MSESHIDPKLIEAWEKGGMTALVLRPLTRATAMSLRHRLYRARMTMRKQGHPSWEVAKLGSISIYPRPDEGDDVWHLAIFPSSAQIEEALATAGLTSGDPPPLD